MDGEESYIDYGPMKLKIESSQSQKATVCKTFVIQQIGGCGIIITYKSQTA